MMEVCTATLPARHGFFTRNGGISTGPYASLNCSFSGGDVPGNVHANRARIATEMGVSAERLLGLKQVHGTTVVTVAEPWETGAGPAADAMVTDRPGLALGVITADCAPVLFSDAGGRIVGAAHAGWRGALAGVLEATEAAMRALGATGIRAAIGPCIHAASYEVAADLRDAVLAREPADTRFFTPGRLGHWQFDLPGYCAARLNAADVATEILPEDTCGQEQKFFSHRRRTRLGETAIGHQLSVITL
jgi:YfiH family protein